ncbi:trypsin-like peptidase domain-containing protein [Amycolatopsis sp. NPDC004747]
MTERGFEHIARRVVQVRGELTGTGFLIQANLVLTAFHVAGKYCTVLVDEDEIPAHTVLKDPELDFALVEVHSSSLAYSNWPWGLVADTALMRLQTWGYPAVDAAAINKKPTPHWWELHAGTAFAGHLGLTLPGGGAPRDVYDQSGKLSTQWVGLSGGPVLSESSNLLVGVVVKYSGRYDSGRIDALDAGRLLEHDGFAARVGNPRPTLVTGAAPGIPTAEKPTLKTTILDVDLLPGTWQPERGPSVSPVHRYRLDAVIGSSAGPFEVVLCDDETAADNRHALATVLTEAEALAAPLSAPRRWFTLADDELGDVAHAAAVAKRLLAPEGWSESIGSDTRGRCAGVVVPVTGITPAGLGPARVGIIAHTLAGLRRLLPEVALVTHVLGPDTVHATHAAQEVATSRRKHGIPTPVLRFRPQAREVTAADRERVGVVLALLGIDAETTGDRQFDPIAVVKALDTAELGDQEEVALLRTITPLQLFTELVHAHAEHRSPPHRMRSLWAVAGSGVDLSTWLDAAGVPSPADMPPRRSAEVALSVVLALLRRPGASEAEVRSWCDYGGRPGHVLGSLLRRQDDRWALDVDRAGTHRDPAAVRLLAAAAAALGLGVHDLPVTAANHPLFWALMVRTPLDDAAVSALTAVPPHLQAVLDGRSDDDIEVIDHVCGLREELPHLGSRGEEHAR